MLNVPSPDGRAYVWPLFRPASEDEARAAVAMARDGESWYRYRAFAVSRFGRRPLFDAQPFSTRRITHRDLAQLDVAFEDRPRLILDMLETAQVFRCIAVLVGMLWDDDAQWGVGAALLAAGWTGSDRELLESVRAATT